MAAEPQHHHLFGSCACQRNQYTVLIPTTTTTTTSPPRAQVFFDNSALSRRAQASPVTAWLRVPLAWYSSTTTAHFPDETPTIIKRTFHTPPSQRQFCGYCGSHLTQWDEKEDDSLDVTLGSLLSESVEKLEALRILPDLESEEEGPSTRHLMSNRGMSYFEELVENSRLGRIKRQTGGHRSRDGKTSVQWEIVEIDGAAAAAAASSSSSTEEVRVVVPTGGDQAS